MGAQRIVDNTVSFSDVLQEHMAKINKINREKNVPICYGQEVDRKENYEKIEKALINFSASARAVQTQVQELAKEVNTPFLA